MLATAGPLPGRGTWTFERKLDGWRALVYVGDGVRVMSRRRKDLTSSVPGLAGLGDALGRDAVLDGELVAGDGTPGSFYGLAGRMAGRGAVTFVAFDVLALDGADLTVSPQSERRAVLDGLGLSGAAWATLPSFTASATDVATVCIEHGLEGMVAKRGDARYRCGQRSTAWLKFKTSTWRQQHAPHRRGVASIER